MNNERRHELQQNDLAIYLDKINKAIEPYSRIIAVLVGVVLIGAIGMGFYKSEKSGQRSAATLSLMQASASQDPENLLSVSQAYAGTTAAEWAKLYQGEQYLNQGIQSLYQDRDNAVGLLGDAQAVFQTAVSSTDQVLRSRAHFGNARAAESLGNLDEAIEAYNEVIAVNESDAMVKKAEARIKALSSPKTQAFLTWFADQDFSPADPSLPPSLPGADSIPAMPDLNLPELNFGDEDERELKDGGMELPADSDVTSDEAMSGDEVMSGDVKAKESMPEDMKSDETMSGEMKPVEAMSEETMSDKADDVTAGDASSDE